MVGHVFGALEWGFNDEDISTVKKNPTVTLASDASGKWGCAACWGRTWFQVHWTSKSAAFGIAAKELIPIVIAAAIWGRQWHGRTVCCYCDNQSVVEMMRASASKIEEIMRMLRCLFFFESTFDFMLTVVHIPGKMNDLADDLSRNRLFSFFSKVPQAQCVSDRVPEQLTRLLIEEQPDWMSQTWTRLFSSILQQV